MPQRQFNHYVCHTCLEKQLLVNEISQYNFSNLEFNLKLYVNYHRYFVFKKLNNFDSNKMKRIIKTKSLKLLYTAVQFTSG